MRAQNVPVLDTSAVIGTVSSIKEVRGLPVGAIVGDRQGGLTFTDAVAAALESRSSCGWHEAQASSGEVWTIIELDR